MRIFLDVGAHYGETLEVVLDPRWGFARVHSFEPASACRHILAQYRDPRVRLEHVGLSNRTGRETLYGAGLLGASVYPDKEPGEPGLPPELLHRQEAIELVRASDWLRAHTAADDEIFLKLNCEGSECDVLEDLLDTGLIARVRHLYVDFDVRKVPSQAHRQAGTERRLRERGIGYATPDPAAGTASAAVRRWLTTTCPRTRSGAGLLRYRLRLYRPPYVWRRSIARAALPHLLFRWTAHRFGPMGWDQAERR